MGDSPTRRRLSARDAVRDAFVGVYGPDQMDAAQSQSAALPVARGSWQVARGHATVLGQEQSAVPSCEFRPAHEVAALPDLILDNLGEFTVARLEALDRQAWTDQQLDEEKLESWPACDPHTDRARWRTRPTGLTRSRARASTTHAASTALVSRP